MISVFLSLPFFLSLIHMDTQTGDRRHHLSFSSTWPPGCIRPLIALIFWHSFEINKNSSKSDHVLRTQLRHWVTCLTLKALLWNSLCYCRCPFFVDSSQNTESSRRTGRFGGLSRRCCFWRHWPCCLVLPAI